MDSIISPLLPKSPSPGTCLPKPHPPDLQRYMQIGSFMKLARRKLHREYKYSDKEHLTFRYWINSVMPCWCFQYMFNTLPKALHCLLCNTVEELKDPDSKLTRGSSDESTDEDEEPDCHNKGLKLKKNEGSERESLIGESKRKKNKRPSFNTNRCGNDEESFLLKSYETKDNTDQMHKNASYDSLKNTNKHRNINSSVDLLKETQINTIQENLPNESQKQFNEPMIIKEIIDNNVSVINHHKKAHKKMSTVLKLLARRKVRIKHKKIYKKKLLSKAGLGFNVILFLKRMFLLEYVNTKPKCRYIKISTINVKKIRRLKRGRLKVKLVSKKSKGYPCNEKTNKFVNNIKNNTIDTSHFNYVEAENSQEHTQNVQKKIQKNQNSHRNAVTLKSHSHKFENFYKLCCYFNENKFGSSKQKKKALENSNSSILNNKANFKRRKKIESNPNHKTEKGNISTRNYCLSTYLFDQNWIKEKKSAIDMNKGQIAKSDLAKLRNKKPAAVEKNENIEDFKKPVPLTTNKCSCSLKICICNQKRHSIKNPEKGVTVLPLVKSSSCQYSSESPTLAHANQIDELNDIYTTDSLSKPYKDAAINIKTQTSTCATQCRSLNKYKSCSCIEINNRSKEFGDTINYETWSDIKSTVTLSEYSFNEDTKTDLTICSRVTIDDSDQTEPYKRRNESSTKRKYIVTKSNKAIITDRTKLCDVSTFTSDWWSPIFERKDVKDSFKRNDRRKQKDKSVSTDGRVVTFMSRPQIIPQGSQIK
ncbi:unnamed protein product, partial [Brenthis ino]